MPIIKNFITIVEIDDDGVTRRTTEVEGIWIESGYVFIKSLDDDPITEREDGGFVFVKDGALYYKGPLGTVTKLADA